MIFGIRIADDALNGPGFDAILKLNHWEAFTLLVIYTHGRGGDPRKRLAKDLFEDHIGSYGVDPSDPRFRKAARSLRKRKSLSRGALPSCELTLGGSLLAYALKKNAESFEVQHPLPTIEALAGVLRYAEQHDVFANSVVVGGVSVEKMNERAQNQLIHDWPEYRAIFPDGKIPEETKEESLEGLLGLGLLFMYDGHVYCINPGYSSEHDD